MKRPYPTSIKVGAVDYSIEELPPDVGREAKLLGDSDTLMSNIRLDFSKNRCVVANTLLHEILHVLWDLHSISHKDGEERIIESMSNGLAAVFRDNPKLTQWIVRALR